MDEERTTDVRAMALHVYVALLTQSTRARNSPWTLALCLTAAVGITNQNFLETDKCMKNSLLQLKTIELLG